MLITSFFRSPKINCLHFTDQHRALLLTLLISGTLVLAIFNIGLKKQMDISAESYYELEPEKALTPEEQKMIKTLETLNNSKAETNSPFNETDNNTGFSQAYRQIAPPEDYVPPSSQDNDGEANESNTLGKNTLMEPALNKEELSSFSKVNNVLKQQQNTGSNTRSTISFSLTDRNKVSIPIPVYLCEEDGRIVINITVNTHGNVIDAYFNNASTSKNVCLVQHALAYAKSSRFSADASKKSQLGTITFNFVGKH